MGTIKNRKGIFSVIAGFICIFLIFLVRELSGYIQRIYWLTEYGVFVVRLGSIVIIMICVLSVGLIIYRFIKTALDRRQQQEFDKQKYVIGLQTILNEDTSTEDIKIKGFNIATFPQNDIIALMTDNLGEIREYFTISKSHARKSFGFAVGAAIFGLALFAGSVVIGLKTGNIDAAIIGAIGGGITELVSIFALHIYKNSQEQLNHYYKALHENEQYLSTVHLVSKLSEDKQDDTYIEIIRSSLERRELLP